MRAIGWMQHAGGEPVKRSAIPNGGDPAPVWPVVIIAVAGVLAVILAIWLMATW